MFNVGRIRELETQIRDFINQYRQTHVLIQDLVKANILWSSLDVVGDTQLAIDTYRALQHENHKDVGFNYLAVYGILQVLYVQQDAVRHIFESLDIPLNLVDPKNFAEVQRVRDVRNKATGHPTKHGKKKQPVTSHYISRNTLSLSGFTLMSADGPKTQFNDISIGELLQKQEAGVIQALAAALGELVKREKDHKMRFKGQTVSSLFPDTLSYYFQKVVEGTLTGKGNRGRWQFGRMHVKLLIELAAKLRQAFLDREVIPASDVIEDDLQDTEYPLQKLKMYYDSAKGHTLNNKDAYIYVFFVKHQFEKLRTLAQEVDQDFQV